MNIYKFKEAVVELEKTTSIPFKFNESKNPEELNRPIMLINTTLPF